jgi:TATA-binding protein-associated factor Taf7
MSAVYNPEADTIARIEAIELEVRELRRKLEHAHNPTDKRVINKQIGELKSELEFLRYRLVS